MVQRKQGTGSPLPITSFKAREILSLYRKRCVCWTWSLTALAEMRKGSGMLVGLQLQLLAFRKSHLTVLQLALVPEMYPCMHTKTLYQADLGGRVSNRGFFLEVLCKPAAQASATPRLGEFGGKMFPLLALFTTHLCALEIVS